MFALRKRDYIIPGDMSLAVFETDDETKFITPKIMTVNQSPLEFGRVTVELCFKQLRHMNQD